MEDILKFVRQEMLKEFVEKQVSKLPAEAEDEAKNKVRTQYETKYPKFRAGDNVTVNYRIVEGEKTRIQAFKGDVIQIKGHGDAKSFTVRKISNGVGVERIFFFVSPNIDSIEHHKHGKVRRSRIYYLRNLVGKKAKIKERKFMKPTN
jgi:large subunit ribosomal protein L19